MPTSGPSPWASVSSSSKICRPCKRQHIYIDPEADFAAIKPPTWPDFVHSERLAETIAAIKAIREHVLSTT